MKNTISDINIYDNFTVKVYINGLVRLCDEIRLINPSDEITNRFYNQLLQLTKTYIHFKYIHVTGKMFNNIQVLLDLITDSLDKRDTYKQIICGNLDSFVNRDRDSDTYCFTYNR